MRYILQRSLYGLLLLTAVMQVAQGDVYRPPEVPIVGVEVPSPLTTLIASTLFAIAIFALLHKRGRHVANRWWATAIVLAVFAGLSVAVCNSIHARHKEDFRKDWNERRGEVGHYLTN